ncbi:hypothetical protein [Corynebacterium simulans]|uniref:hypothetical protein n=1 Tax=Corynebacterium simulans TaxID=146827 RepID=UPI0020046A4F|nr:hypothetical protein [Corynebacterium simulans]MCK6160903.1 hypothetical protein [Corynebacterium simulans]
MDIFLETVDELHEVARSHEDPAFDEVLYHRDPSGICITGMAYEDEQTYVVTYRGPAQEGTIYRATPFIGVVETAGKRFAALVDAPFALPAGNPAGGEALQGTLYPALLATHVESAGHHVTADFEAPDTERFYSNYKPSMLTPRVRVTGAVRGVQEHIHELTENEFWVGQVAGFAVVFEEEPPAHAAIDAVAVCATPFWDEA